MATIQFENGQKVNFQGHPTPQDIEEVASHLGIQKSQVSQPETSQMFGSGLPFSKQMTGQEFINQPLIKQIAQAAIHTIPKDIADFYRYIPQATSELAVSAGEVPTDIYAFATGKEKITPTYNVPLVGKVQSLQSQAQNVLQSPRRTPGDLEKKTLGNLGLEMASSNEPFSFRALTLPSLKGLQDAAITSQALSTAANVGAKVFGDFNLTTGKATSGLVEKIPGEAKKVLSGIQESGQGILKQNAINDWAKPATKKSLATYNKAYDIYNNALDNGHNIPETLVNNGIKISDNVEGGKYATAETANLIREDAGKMSRDLLRPALEAASPSVEYVSTDEIIQKAKQGIGNSNYVLPEDKIKLLNQLDDTGSALSTKYPGGMSLIDIHDEKILRDLNSKYSPIGDIATNQKAQLNKTLADVLRNTLEKAAPENIPVEAFNSELQKQYQAANYLDALDTKKIPSSIAAKIAKTTAKVIGAATGSHLGGGILGGVGGYHIGGMVESTLEGLPTNIRDSLLNNLQQTNSEVFSKVSEALGQIATEQATRLALPQSETIYGNAPTYKSGLPSNEQLQAENNARIKLQQDTNTLRLPSPGQTTQNAIPLPQPGVLRGQGNINQTSKSLPLLTYEDIKDLTPEQMKKIPAEQLSKIDIESLIEKFGGWPERGLRQKFDTALLEKNADEVKRILPMVPMEYKQRFADKIESILNPDFGFKELPSLNLISKKNKALDFLKKLSGGK